MKPNRTVTIVGGGLAGLAMAQALRFFGLRADIYESAPQLGEIGAAINASPNANKSLILIGLGDRIAAIGTQSLGTYTRNMQTGEFLECRDQTEVLKRFTAPYYVFHRADLLGALADGLDPSSIHLGHRLVEIEERGATNLLRFANGKTVTADTVIAADGVRSVVRRALYGDDNPSYTGQMVWRSLLLSLIHI